MGLLQRLALVIRSYMASTTERLDRVAAEEEASETEARRKAIEEIRSMQVSSDALRAPTPVTRQKPSSDSLAADYRFLGLRPGSDLKTVEAAWRALASRADPKRFTAGSDEEKRAAELLESINAAYTRIRDAVNPTEGRFGQLEL